MDANAGGRHFRVEFRLSAGIPRTLSAWLALLLLALAGCRGAGEETDRMVPPWWRGNPWGPEANSARTQGVIPSVPSNPDMLAWTAWGKQNLQNGDIIFRMGDARAVLGLFPFSKVSAGIAGSQYSHSGVVAIENGDPFVYDTTTKGPQRQPLAIWVIDTRGSLAVKRPIAPYQKHAGSAADFCRSVYQKQTPFDFDMKLGDDRLYCIELTERAYDHSGLSLSNPIRLDHLPKYPEYPLTVRLMKRCTKMVPHQLAYVIGNDTIGIWASPTLTLVYEAPDARPPHSRPSPLSTPQQSPSAP